MLPVIIRSFWPLSPAFGLTLLAVAVLPANSSAQVLIGNPFLTGFEGWEDTYVGTPVAGGLPTWGTLLTPDPISGQRFLMETSDGRGADGTTTAGVADGNYEPFILINSLDTTPADYSITSQLATADNDGFGLVFGYQDNNNYFRVGFREQAGGNLGFQEGTSVQKIVNGTVTQLASSPSGFIPTSNGAAFEAKVVVNGANWDVQVANPAGSSFVSILSSSDADLQPGKYGVHSWGQHEVSANVPNYGTIVGTVAVQSATLNKTTDFANAVSSIPWRRLVMVNSFGETGFEEGGPNVLEDHGNFAQDFINGVIRDDSNGNVNATAATPNIDFMGPAIVVDSPGAASMTDYSYTVRIENGDNDGAGLLFRVADDNNFYRVNWNTEGPGTGTTRPPIGMSIQKYTNFSWTEIYRDDQANPLFLPQDSVPFDVSIQAVGNQFKVDIVNDPEGTPQPISYGTITDNSFDPILAGSVGFTNWGNGEGSNGVEYSAFNGGSESLVKAITSFLDFRLTVDRNTGKAMLVNNATGAVDIRGVSILSGDGTINPANWLSIADNYDEPPGDMSVDPDDPWTEISSTDFELSEREDSGGNGGTLTGGEMVDLGNIWRKSRIEDLALLIELTDGNSIAGEVSYFNGPGGISYSRSDLNTDGSVNATDWGLFYPNLLSDMSSMSGWQRAVAGDLDLDGDNDVDDFALFKLDYDTVNGAGAFQAMLTGVPEPSTAMFILLSVAVLFVTRVKRCSTSTAFALGIVSLLLLGRPARAVPLDLTTFVVENFPNSDDGSATGDTFPDPAWEVTTTTASLNNNADATLLYSPTSIFNQRITGTLTPGSDDDVVGFVLGFEPGDTAIGSSADYILIDWKGASQNFDFFDWPRPTPPDNGFHGLTGTGVMPVGLAISRVTGSANADELWQHTDFAESPTGGVTELARATTLGSTPYDRSGGSHQFEIIYTEHFVNVKVDGVEQLHAVGTFPTGRFGLYSAWQGPTATFSDFDVTNDVTVPILTATVDRSDGTVTLNNPFSGDVEFDYYQFTSSSNSLDEDLWNSLSEQNFQPSGAGAHQKWQEAGGSSAAAIGEAYLDGNSTLGGNTSHSIGQAYNYLINGEDLIFQYRLITGEVRAGFVEYVGIPPQLAGDYDNSGQVAQGDLDLVLLNWGKTVPPDPVPAGWINEQPVGLIGQSALDGVLLNWGNTAGSGAALGVTASVPEPTALVMLILAAARSLIRQRRAERAVSKLGRACGGVVYLEIDHSQSRARALSVN